MKMHPFIKIVFSGIILVFLFLTACQLPKHKEIAKATESKQTQKPNIIYIMADDLAMQAISAYGGRYKDIAPTPNIDRLANEGMLFQNMTCTNAICGPSRASILTGDYSNIHGYYKNESGGKFNDKLWTFPQEFQKNNYQTALFGKWHLGSAPKGFDMFKYHNSANQQGQYWNPVYNENGKDVKEKGYATNLTTQFALDWLDKTRDKHKPFLMLLQFKAPHRSWQPDHKYEHIWDSIEMPYPENFNDDYKGRELTAGDTEMTMDYLTRRDMKLTPPSNLKGKEKVKWDFYGAKKGQIVQPEGMSKEEGRKWRYQRFIKGYLACVKSVDDNIGKVLDYLDQNGLADNTLIVLTSDQGFFLGEHGFFDKRFIYEESLHMPFIVRYPKKIKPSSINKSLIKNIDIAPTLLDVAHIQTGHNMQGKSFTNEFYNRPDPANNAMYYHYYEFPYWHHVQPHYGIRTDKYTLAHFYYNIDVWELYDLTKDPMQMHNEIDNPQYTNVVNHLKKRLKGLMKQYKNDKPLSEFRKITDTDFGSLVKLKKGETSVEEMISGKKYKYKKNKK